MKTELQKQLAKIAPFICIRTLWEHDQDSGPISKGCDGFTEDDDDDWTAWQSEVKASAIYEGEEISGSDYLGGTFEKAGDAPDESNPTISGYEEDMTRCALDELSKAIQEHATKHNGSFSAMTATLEQIKAAKHAINATPAA